MRKSLKSRPLFYNGKIKSQSRSFPKMLQASMNPWLQVDHTHTI